MRPDADPGTAPPRANILIVDDTPENLRLLNQMLKQQYKVRLAPNGSIALAAARAAPPDLVLLDIMMPDMSGYEVAAALKADPLTRDAPIIFISALSDINSKIEGFQAGGVDYVTKPFHEEEVLARVRTHLSIRALHQQARAEIAERKRIEAAEREQHQLADALRETAESLSSSLDLDEVFEKILDKVDQVVRFDALSVTWLEGEQARLVRVRGFEPGPARQLKSVTFHIDHLAPLRQVIQSHAPVVIPDARRCPDWQPLPALAWVQSHLEAPIIIGEKVVGSIHLESATRGFYGEHHTYILQTFANQAAVAARNAQLYAETQRLTLIDPLTGLYNRRGLATIGVRDIERARRFRQPVSMIFIDIDRFKQINDSYSYEVGDQGLCAFARQIGPQIRKADLFCRYGGEEFIILMPDAPLENAAQTAERLRAIIAALQCDSQAGSISITASFGVVSFTPEGGRPGEAPPDTQQQLNDLLERAGGMLHAAKQNGRNRVEVEGRARAAL
ncbi:MAG: diguanylate cyclase [Chloroflexota bacterium]